MYFDYGFTFVPPGVKSVIDPSSEPDIFTYLFLLFLTAAVSSSILKLSGSLLLVLTVSKASPSVVGLEECPPLKYGTLRVST